MTSQGELLPTGIKGLDEAIGGGLLRGRTYLVTGETGTGKTLFALSFLINGIYKYGEAGVYVSVDETYEQLVRGARLFGWDLEALRDSGYLQIVVPELDLIERIREKSPLAVAKGLLSDIATCVKEVEATRLVIDPIAPLVTLEKDVQVLREFIRVLILGIERELGVTTIITTEIPTGSKAISRYGVEEFLAAGVFVMGLVQSPYGDFKRYLFIRKMRWQPVHPTVLEFEIVPRVGIVVKGPLKGIDVGYMR